MSEASDEVVAAEECRASAYDRGDRVDPMHAAILHALLAIRAELRTANLLAARADSLVADVADAIGVEIREELDLDDRETR